MKAYELKLSEDDRRELFRMRDSDRKPYLRERASALLQIGSGKSARWVAFHGLLKRRRKNTVYEWVHRFEAEGLEGLKMREGRGRKAAFSPKASR